MKVRNLILGGMLAAVLTACTTISMQYQYAQQKGGEDESGPYEVVTSWPLPLHTDGWSWGSTAGVWADTPDRIFVFGRGELEPAKGVPGADGQPKRAPATSLKPRWEHVLMVFNRSGNLIESWEQHNSKFVRPHRVTISPYDPEKNVWLVDDGAHQIFKFSGDGKQLLMVLGEKGKPGSDPYHFNRPTDVAFLPNGDFYVSDGYVNTRVAKFDKNGKFMFQWGRPGNGPGEFDLVHSLAIDADKERIYVADRTNSRIQIFDLNGNYIDEWKNIRSPYYVAMTKDGLVAVSDGMIQKILKFDLNGQLLYSWGTFGVLPGQLWGVHQMSVDSEGNLYTAEVFSGRPQKFRPRAGANPQQLLGQTVHSLSR